MVANPTKRASSSGERAAILGYSKQYEFAACKIYRAMLSGNLNWVSFGNDDVGMFDDAIICSHQVINAFQIKTSEDPNSISISTALKDSDLKNIFESYTKIVSLYGTQAIQLNYVFAGYFSRQDRSAANNKSGGNLHTYALATFLNAYSSSESEYLDTNWSDYLKQWKDLSGFSEEKFGQFLSAIRLYDREEIAKEKIDNFDDEAQEKITLLSSLILTLVKKSSHKNTWSEDELIKELGWQKQLSQKFNHVFPIPENYQDNIATRQAIETILENTESGYISLLGAPGSGKSSLLERAIRTSKSHSVVRYLSFHPDRRHGLGRGEASEFLNDIVVALGKTGLPAKRLQRSDLSRLKEHFSDQLTAAGQRYEDTGKKTIIIVDGLDHIPREENPSESFLGVLPLPHSIPSGVVFLLGSQKLDLENLPLSVGQQAGQGDRTVSVQKLKRSDIAEIMRGGNMSEKVKISNFYASCEGNPLVAQYLLKALQGTNDEETIQSILSREHGIGRDIQEIYERLWKTIDDNHKLHDVLALLARSEGKISASELASETSDEQVEILLQQVSYLLDVEADTQISIFHNSFRLFIVEKTAMRFGKFNESKDQAYNMQLANIASNATKSSSQRWLELRYLYRAGKFEKVLKICTPKYFRSQLIEFRPESEIYTDLRLSYGSLNFSRDRVQLVKLLLIDKEISYRLEAISEMDAIELLMDGGAIDKAIKIALDGSMYGDGWKALVLFLLERNKKEVARQIFELNEPTEVLYGERQYQGRNLTDELETWIELARYFRSNSDILSIINAVAIDKTFGDDPDTDTLRLELRYHLAFQIVVENPQAINKKIGETYSLDREALIRLAIEAAEHQVKNDDIDSAREIFKRITCSGDLKKLHISWTRSALFLASKLGRDDLVADLLKITKPVSIGEYQNTSFRSDFKYILESRFLTSTLSLIHKYPALNNENSNKPVAVKLAKKIAELAIIIFNLENNEASEVGLKIKPIIAFWGNVRSTDNYDSLITAFRSNIEWLLPKIFRIIRHFDDKEFTSDIIQIILSVIETKGSNFANSDKFKLLFAEFLYDFEDYKNTALTLIGGVKSWSGDEYTPHEEVATKVLICHTLSNIGQIEDSRNFASKIHEGTLGYWLRAKKEPQYLFWNLALKNACAEEPDKCLGYTASYAKFLLGMEETEGHGTAYRMADDLLRGASYNPSSCSFFLKLLLN